MRIGVFGSKDWDNYPDIMRTLTVFVQDANDAGDEELLVIHAPNRGADDMVTEYIGKVDRFLNQKGFRLREYFVKKDSPALTDMAIMESSIDHAVVFTTGCRRTRFCIKALNEYEIPTTIIEK